MFQISGQPSGIDIDTQTGEIIGSPDIGASLTNNGAYDVAVTATDDDGGQTVAHFSWQVNKAPLTFDDPGSQNNHPEDAVDFFLNANDPDGDTLTFTASGLPGGLSINASTGEITGTLADNAVSTTASVTASDGHGDSLSYSVSWTVTPIADHLTMFDGILEGAGRGQSTDFDLFAMTDVNPAAKPADFSVTIDWGDGSAPSSGSVGSKDTGGMYQIMGNHPYSANGSYVAKATVTGPNGVSGTAISSVRVADFMAGQRNTTTLHRPAFGINMLTEMPWLTFGNTVVRIFPSRLTVPAR